MELLFLGKIFAVFLVLGVLFIVVDRMNQKGYYNRMKTLLEQEWGCPTREEYTEKILQNISYYASETGTEQDIDDITWNDLEMDEVFANLNHTRTSAGEEVLYRLLRTPCFESEELEKREQVIQSLAQYENQRHDLEMALFAIGKNDKISIYEYLNRTKELAKISKWKHLVSALILLAAVAALFVTPSVAIIALFVIMVSNSYYYYKEKAKIGPGIGLFQFVLGTVRQCRMISKIEVPCCEEYIQSLGKLSERFAAFSRFRFLVTGGNSVSGSLFDAVFDYIRILFHVDLIKYATMVRELQKNQLELLEMYKIIGFLDSMLAVASYRCQLGDYAIPKLYPAKKGEEVRQISAKGLYHPLLREPVKNDFETQRGMLLTGSNASGKSTFIKAVAINAIFAQTIHTVLADSYVSPFYRVYSSMALRDNILSNESYFIVEIKSLKRIFSHLQDSEIPVLCFIDEILRGTNTIERVAASTQLLQELAAGNAMCFAATHDIELTYLLKKSFENYHFEEVLGEEDIAFDYLLKKGRANSRNAIRLLSLIGFSEEIVAKAQERVEYFLTEGNWKETE